MVAPSRTTGVRPDDAFLRYEKTWRIADLDNAITIAKAKLELVGHSNRRRRAVLLNDLGCYYQERHFRSDYEFNQKCSISDLQEGVAFAEQAVKFTSFNDPLPATHTANLAKLLLTLWEEDPDSTESDLRKAVEMSESAVRQSLPDSADTYLHHIQLAKALLRKALAYNTSSLLRRAIEYATKAERAVGAKHAKRGLVLSEIAEVYYGKFKMDGDQRSKREALEYAVRAFEATSLDSVDRDKIFIVWGRMMSQ